MPIRQGGCPLGGNRRFGFRDPGLYFRRPIDLIDIIRLAVLVAVAFMCNPV
jgi:hypothetical protein